MKHFTREAIFALEPPEVADAMAAALGMVSSGSAIAPIRANRIFAEHWRAAGDP